MMRDHVIKEIRSSELSYSESLRQITEVRVFSVSEVINLMHTHTSKNLVVKLTEANLLTSAEHYMLFANIGELSDIHKTFYENLSATIDERRGILQFAKSEVRF